MFVNQIMLETAWKRVLWVLESPGIQSLQVLESPGKQYFTVCTNPVNSSPAYSYISQTISFQENSSSPIHFTRNLNWYLCLVCFQLLVLKGEWVMLFTLRVPILFVEFYVVFKVWFASPELWFQYLNCTYIGIQSKQPSHSVDFNCLYGTPHF